MKSRIYFIYVVVILVSFFQNAVIYAQNIKNSDAPISLCVITDWQSELPLSVQTTLRDKLMKVVVGNGLGYLEGDTRFAITVSVNPEEENYIPGPPKQISAKYNITLYIVDNVDRSVFSTVSFNQSAIGYSREKALLTSVRAIKETSPIMENFIDAGRRKIVDYYNDNIDVIISKSRQLARQGAYEEALYLLSCVPAACQSAYGKAVSTGDEIWTYYVNYEGSMLLSKAKAAWSACPDSAGAGEAGEYLCRINPDAECYPSALALFDEIKEKIQKEDELRMKVYQDDVDIEKQRIAAWRDVGVSFGEHQQPEHLNVNWISGKIKNSNSLPAE